MTDFNTAQRRVGIRNCCLLLVLMLSIPLAETANASELVLVQSTLEKYEDGLLVSDRAPLPSTTGVMLNVQAEAPTQQSGNAQLFQFFGSQDFMIQPGAGEAPGTCVVVHWQVEATGTATSSGSGDSATTFGSDIVDFSASTGPAMAEATSSDFTLELNDSPVLSLPAQTADAPAGAASLLESGSFFAAIGDEISYSVAIAAAAAVDAGGQAFARTDSEVSLELSNCSPATVPVASGLGLGLLVSCLGLAGLVAVRTRR